MAHHHDWLAGLVLGSLPLIQGIGAGADPATMRASGGTSHATRSGHR